MSRRAVPRPVLRGANRRPTPSTPVLTYSARASTSGAAIIRPSVDITQEASRSHGSGLAPNDAPSSAHDRLSPKSRTDRSIESDAAPSANRPRSENAGVAGSADASARTSGSGSNKLSAASFADQK